MTSSTLEDKTRSLLLKHTDKTRRLATLHADRMLQSVDLFRVMQGGSPAAAFSLSGILAKNQANKVKRITDELLANAAAVRQTVDETRDNLAVARQTIVTLRDDMTKGLALTNQIFQTTFENFKEELNQRFASLSVTGDPQFAEELKKIQKEFNDFKGKTEEDFDKLVSRTGVIGSELGLVSKLSNETLAKYLFLRQTILATEFMELGKIIAYMPEDLKLVIDPKHTELIQIRRSILNLQDQWNTTDTELNTLQSQPIPEITDDYTTLQEYRTKLEKLAFDIAQIGEYITKRRIRPFLQSYNEFEMFVDALRRNRYIQDPVTPHTIVAISNAEHRTVILEIAQMFDNVITQDRSVEELDTQNKFSEYIRKLG